MPIQTTIVICYARGTYEMMSACLSSIQRYTTDNASILVAAAEGSLDQGLFEAVDCFQDKPLHINVTEVPREYLRDGQVHGCILDKAIQHEVNTEYVLTMDSDSIPLKQGWLSELQVMMTPDVCTAGILHPWAPPPSMNASKLEYRVRTQHCWKTTHVACQLIRLSDITELRRHGIGYTTGDDTGLGMVKALKDAGRICVGYKPTRCPKPETDFDAEFNRYSCVVYGDAVVHVGGFTRVTVDGDDAVFYKAFGWAGERILEDGNADFLMTDEYSYKYKFDREEEIAAEKMQRLFGLEAQRMTV